MQGRPGPVVDRAARGRADRARRGRRRAARRSRSPIWPGLTQMAELQKRLWAAERPIAIVGGPGWTAKATAAVLRFAERFDLPVAAQFRRASALDGEHPNYCGEIGLAANPKLKARIEDADLVLLIGGRMSEAASQGYTLFGIPAPQQTLDPRPRRRQRDRPQLSPRRSASSRPPPPSPPRWRACSRRPRSPGARRPDRRARTISPGATQAPRDAGRACSWPRSCSLCADASRTRSSPPAPAISRSGSTASCASARSSSSSGRPAARWVLACRRRSPPSSSIPIASSSASPATAIS